MFSVWAMLLPSAAWMSQTYSINNLIVFLPVAFALCFMQPDCWASWVLVLYLLEVCSNLKWLFHRFNLAHINKGIFNKGRLYRLYIHMYVEF